MLQINPPSYILLIYFLEDLQVWGVNVRGLLEGNQRRRFNTTEDLAKLSKSVAGTGALKPFALALVVSLTSTATALPLLSPETSASCHLLSTAFKKKVNTETTYLGPFVVVFPFQWVSNFWLQ